MGDPDAPRTAARSRPHRSICVHARAGAGWRGGRSRDPLRAGCGDDARDPEPTPAAADSFAEFIVATDGGFIFERVDRATPEPLEANQGETCFTDPAWAYNGAPYDRGDSLTQLPTGTERGEVNVMHQCVLAGRT
jgi:hypothetical protein